MDSQPSKRLVVLVLLYMAASLIHFIHNAEYLATYPNLPTTWTRAGVYFVWIGMTMIGVIGLLLIARGFAVFGLLAIATHAICGMDSLGHYVVAPFSAHSEMMNVTILLEVSAASLVLIEATRLMMRRRRKVGQTT